MSGMWVYMGVYIYKVIKYYIYIYVLAWFFVQSIWSSNSNKSFFSRINVWDSYWAKRDIKIMISSTSRWKHPFFIKQNTNEASPLAPYFMIKFHLQAKKTTTCSMVFKQIFARITVQSVHPEMPTTSDGGGGGAGGCPAGGGGIWPLGTSIATCRACRVFSWGWLKGPKKTTNLTNTEATNLRRMSHETHDIKWRLIWILQVWLAGKIKQNRYPSADAPVLMV